MAKTTHCSSRIAPVEMPVQTNQPRFGIELVEVDALVQASEARARFNVAGEETVVAVLDTGLRVTHVDFKDRIVKGLNFTSENGGDNNNPSDGQGHGTNVTGIIAADGDHVGIAPRAQILPVKVLGNDGRGDFSSIIKAFDWIIENRDIVPVSAICMSLSDGQNYRDDDQFASDELAQKLRALANHRVPCIVSAGNHYFSHGSTQGMAYPAIIAECISVGAVYDSDEGAFSYDDGAQATSSSADRITPFSQRLHPETGRGSATDIFAPGAPVTSTGILSDNGESTQQGTSQAAPVVAGVILLMQSLYKRVTGEMPSVEYLAKLIKIGAIEIFDGDDEDDNVEHTNQHFRRVNAPKALQSVLRHLQQEILKSSS